MLFSASWLRTVLAAGFVPNKQHGIFVVEKRHMFGSGWDFFPPGPPNFRGISKPLSEVVQTNLDSNLIGKDKNWPEKCKDL